MQRHCSPTLEQFLNCIEENYVIDAAFDAHYGYVAPIGSVIVTKIYIVPSWVDMIGVELLQSKLKENILEKSKNKNEIYKTINQTIDGAWNQTRNTKLKIKKSSKILKNWKQNWSRII